MKKVYASDNFPLIGHLRQVLESHHIGCVIRNEHLIGGAGELPFNECWPELWITENHQYDRASELVRAMLAIDMERASDWSCPACAEPIEGQFSACWRCGEDRRFGD